MFLNGHLIPTERGDSLNKKYKERKKKQRKSCQYLPKERKKSCFFTTTIAYSKNLLQ